MELPAVGVIFRRASAEMEVTRTPEGFTISIAGPAFVITRTFSGLVPKGLPSACLITTALPVTCTATPVRVADSPGLRTSTVAPLSAGAMSPQSRCGAGGVDSTLRGATAAPADF